jgi:hypothetical protein
MKANHDWNEGGYCRRCGLHLDEENIFATCSPAFSWDEDDIEPTRYDEIGAEALLD